MALAPGDRLGPYDIAGALGAGGMGEVYRAHDTTLNRSVALKILPDAFASDPDRLARFTREAQTLAALNHPHIAQIYGIHDGPHNGVRVRALVPCRRSPSNLTRHAPIAWRVWARRRKVPKSDVIRALIDRAGPIETGEDLLEWVDASLGKGLGLTQRKP